MSFSVVVLVPCFNPCCNPIPTRPGADPAFQHVDAAVCSGDGSSLGRSPPRSQPDRIYGAGSNDSLEHTYSPAECTGIDKRVIVGTPDPALISTSYVERQNLTMRMGMRRLTRLTLGFSKKVENLAHTVSLHYMFYNFARPHQTLTKRYGRPTTPAMAVGKVEHVWSVWEIVGLLDCG